MSAPQGQGCILVLFVWYCVPRAWRDAWQVVGIQQMPTSFGKQKNRCKNLRHDVHNVALMQLSNSPFFHPHGISGLIWF